MPGRHDAGRSPARMPTGRWRGAGAHAAGRGPTARGRRCRPPPASGAPPPLPFSPTDHEGGAKRPTTSSRAASPPDEPLGAERPGPPAEPAEHGHRMPRTDAADLAAGMTRPLGGPCARPDRDRAAAAGRLLERGPSGRRGRSEGCRAVAVDDASGGTRQRVFCPPPLDRPVSSHGPSRRGLLRPRR
jgi:hypothetical protein